MENEVAVMKAGKELEELYLGVKDSSVDLTFKHLVIFKQQHEQEQAQEKNKDIAMEPIHEEKEGENLKKKSPIISKSPNLNFSKVLQQEANNNNKGGFKGVKENSQVHDDVNGYQFEKEQKGIKRQGIPHTSICALCNVYVRFFRHRCLVCGRVYCRKCVVKGMGAMTEGRKCMDCLGKRFSQRYIQRAGNTGCCCRYPGSVKQQELKWAEKGPRWANQQHLVGMRVMTPEIRGTPTRLSEMAPGTPKFDA